MKVTSSPVTAAHGALFNPSNAVMDFRVTTHFLLNLASTQRSLKMAKERSVLICAERSWGLSSRFLLTLDAFEEAPSGS
ncbi:hypothetical protein JOQ06_000345 [Pogonophryne albipinna]|uniref:Uncharacterized protein n=1 Tax=Pogonophryne albipinna TaxID=1090488 RepID=A0AAD6F7Z8_9TELE|nr:hypothetical protein JOQ06_000345 [Pogonophryne albipinna]